MIYRRDNFNSDFRDIIIISSMLVTVFVLFIFVLSFFQQFVQSRNELDGIEHLRIVVEKLVRRASQFEDHGKIGFSQKIAIDLRLAEAESSLKQADSVKYDLLSRLFSSKSLKYK